MGAALKVALFRGRVSLISRAIEWDTRSPYCHAAIVQTDGSVIESIEGVGVHRLPRMADLPAGDTYDLFTVQGLTEAGEMAVERFLGAQLGLPYATLDILGFLTRSSQPANRDAFFCSELVFAAIEAGGVSLLSRIAPFQVSPGMLALSPLLIPAT